MSVVLLTLLAFVSLVLVQARRGQNSWFNPSGGKQCNWLSKSKKYSCDYKNLLSVPTDIPADTEILGLSNNQLKLIDSNNLRADNGFALNKLRILDLSSNKLEALVAQAFTNTPNLEILDIHDNELQTVAPQAFSPLHSLRYLHLQHNKLTTLRAPGATPFSYFEDNAQLMYLDLSENSILSIENNLFAPNPSLSHLNLRSNAITQMETGTFDNNTALQSIDVYDNKITQEVGGTYKQLFATELTYLAQSSPPVGNITKDEDGQLPWRRADCGVCVNQALDCIDIRKLYGVSSKDKSIDFATTFPAVGKYTMNATVDLRDICVGSCGTCMVGLIESRCWDFEESRCLPLEGI